MKLKTLRCPSCGASIDVDIQGRNSVFCCYCGQQILLDDENREFTYNKNENISKTIHKRYTNDADVIRAKTEAKENRNFLITFGAIIGAFVLMAALCLGVPALIKAGNKNAGNISAGYYRDLVGEDYKTIEAHFKAAGFTNIELIDLNDAGIAFWNEGKVVTISVGGDTSFDSMDFFAPNTKVVISYH